MKKHIKALFLILFSFSLALIMFTFYVQEKNSLLNCSIISQTTLEHFLEGKAAATVPSNLLNYEAQSLPYRRDINSFLIPYNTSNFLDGTLSCSNLGDIYFPESEALSIYLSEGISALQASIPIYVINSSTYYETNIYFSNSTILTFDTNAFEHENAYGKVSLYTPNDSEIGTYSSKSSEAKLSYDALNKFSLKEDRNYSLKLLKEGEKNDLKLANLRKDDDWELDSLLGASEDILQFYSSWNNFCSAIGEERFSIHYQIVDFYLDDCYVGPYLLRVPIDDKQLKDSDGIWLNDINYEDTIYGEQIRTFLNNNIFDSSIYLEYYFREEEHDNQLITYAVPRRFTRIIPVDETEQLQ